MSAFDVDADYKRSKLASIMSFGKTSDPSKYDGLYTIWSIYLDDPIDIAVFLGFDVVDGRGCRLTHDNVLAAGREDGIEYAIDAFLYHGVHAHDLIAGRGKVHPG